MVLVIAVVVSATAIALAVGIATANTEFSATFRTVALGPIQLTVSDSGPSAGLVWLAGISIVIVALIALAVALPVTFFLAGCFEIANDSEAPESWLFYGGIVKLLCGLTVRKHFNLASAPSRADSTAAVAP